MTHYPHTCQYCGKKYTIEGNIKGHYREGEKGCVSHKMPPCEPCGHTFAEHYQDRAGSLVIENCSQCNCTRWWDHTVDRFWHEPDPTAEDFEASKLALIEMEKQLNGNSSST